MAKFENYANQSAAMGMRGGDTMNWGSSVIRELFKLIGNMNKKKIYIFLAIEKMELKCLLKFIVK